MRRFRFLHFSAVIVGLALSALLVGCQRGDGRLPVTGTVTIDGKPATNGSIRFQPIEANAAKSSGGAIRQGAFEIEAAKGLPPGKYAITVQSYRETGRIIHDAQAGDLPESKPVDLEPKSTAVAIVAGSQNHFDVRLTTRKTQ